MTFCTPQLADDLIADICERERVARLRDRELISEVLEDDEIDVDHPLIAELLNRLNPFWTESWGERQGH